LCPDYVSGLCVRIVCPDCVSGLCVRIVCPDYLFSLLKSNVLRVIS
jgi:hypothetical protein